MPKLPKKKSLNRERSVPYEGLIARPLTRSRTSLLNLSEHRRAFSELHELDELRKALEEEADTARRRTVVTRQMSKSKENKKELETILNSPKIQKYIKCSLSLNCPKICNQSKRYTEPKAMKTPTKEKVSRKRSVNSSVSKSPKKNNAYINTENENAEFAMGDCSMDLNENVGGDQISNLGEIHRDTVAVQSVGTILETGNIEISMNEGQQNPGSCSEHCLYPINEIGEDLNNSAPALEQVPTEKSSETICESGNVRSVFNLESENFHQSVEETNSSEWQGYFTKFIGSVVQSTSSFFRNVFIDFLDG